MASEKGLQGLPGINELSFIIACAVSITCATMVCTTCTSMVRMYYPSTFVLVTYVVCTNVYFTGLKRLFVSIHPCDVRDSMDVTA